MILVVGATGIVGNRVVELLLAQGQHQIRVLARGKSDWASSVLPRYRRNGIDVIVGDIRQKSTCQKAVEGCSAVINCSGLMRSTHEQEIEEVNVQGLAVLAEAAAAAGVQRFIQLSCLGATEHSAALYFRSKWQSENIIRNSQFYWTIFRPSLIFGEGSKLASILSFWTTKIPFTVVVGSGLNRFQPVAANVLASCIVQSIFNRDCVGQTYEIVGPEAMDLNSLLTLVSQTNKKPLFTIKIPSFIGLRIAALFGKLNPNSPIDKEVMTVMTSEMLASPELMLKTFEVKAIAFQESLKQIESD